MEISKLQDYKSHCLKKNIPVFSQYWWLDAEFGKNKWSVALVYENNQIIASMPFQIPFGPFKKSGMPRFAQTLGPWIDFSIIDSSKYGISKIFDIKKQLISQLPKTGYFIQQFHWSIKYHLPFYWDNFKQETQYTYQINILNNIDIIINNFYPSKRRALKKSKEIVYLDENYDPELFYDDYLKFLNAKGEKIQYSKDVFLKVYHSSIENNSGKIFCAKDKHGNVHSSLFIVWDSMSAYHLITPINPKYRNSNSLTFLIVEALKFLIGKSQIYDFE